MPRKRHAAHVIGRAVGLHLPEEPHALLRIRQRHRLAAVYAGDLPLQVTLAIAWMRATSAQNAPSSLASNRAERQLHVARLARAGNDLCGQQRVATQGEEIIARPTGQVQDIAPDASDLLLRSAVCGSTCSRCCHTGAGSALRSTLPLGPRGMCARAISCAGTMYAGRCSASTVNKASAWALPQ